LLKKYKWEIIVFIAAVFMAGCAGSPVIDKPHGPKMAAEKQRSIFELSPADADIFREALTYLNNRQGAPDYNAAKAKLGIFIQEHPRSKWVESAQALILIINNLINLQEKVKIESLELSKANAEKAKLKKDYKYSEEKYQTETVKLQQENEQLKNDIELLRKLEIQMGQREKMLK
jgi:hypothetical protein